MNNVRKKCGKINIPRFCRFDEPMKLHTSFQIGGPADLFCSPASVDELRKAVELAGEIGEPLTLLGDGTNVLVADEGVRGIVVSLRRLDRFRFENPGLLYAEAGALVSDLSEHAAAHGMSGIEFFYSLPGSLGGAVFMNARCYGNSTAEVVKEIDYLESTSGRLHRVGTGDCGFAYKDSVFQHNGGIILGASLELRPGDAGKIKTAMDEYRADREAKGHFDYPCAGSAFKNNRAFGEPSGKIIDSLDLRGLSIGGAAVSPRHANIVINRNNASARDVRSLLEEIKRRVFDAYGHRLEEEIRYCGDWRDEGHGNND